MLPGYVLSLLVSDFLTVTPTVFSKDDILPKDFFFFSFVAPHHVLWWVKGRVYLAVFSPSFTGNVVHVYNLM